MHVNDIPYLKRNTKGSKAMSSVEGVDGMCVIHNGCTDIVVITESGRANRISLIQGMPNNGRGKSGSNLIKLASGDRIVGVVSGNESDLIHIKCTDTDSVIPITNLQIGSSISAGEKVLTTRGNKILHCYIEKQQM
jgi:DNA gyrase/topoisomerase IV subunit A